MILQSLKAAIVVFLAVVIQVSIFSSVDVLGGTPDFLLVALVAVSLLRGSIAGAVLGFAAGIVADTATLSPLGTTSLLLTLVGYWVGRYGETTGRDRWRAPYLATLVVTVLYPACALLLRVILGEPASARVVLVDAMPPELLWNLVLIVPLGWLLRRLVRQAERSERASEVRLVG